MAFLNDIMAEMNVTYSGSWTRVANYVFFDIRWSLHSYYIFLKSFKIIFWLYLNNYFWILLFYGFDLFTFLLWTIFRININDTATCRCRGKEDKSVRTKCYRHKKRKTTNSRIFLFWENYIVFSSESSSKYTCSMNQKVL